MHEIKIAAIIFSKRAGSSNRMLLVSAQGVGFVIASSSRHPRVSNQMQTIPIISAVFDYFQNMSRNHPCQQVIRMLLFVNCLFSELAETNLIGKLQNT